jgi:hypothetical protein
MKKLLLTIVGVCAMGAHSQATLTFYEGFNYATGADLATQSASAWANVNSGDNVPVVSGSLNVSGLQASTGNSVTFDGAGIDEQRSFTAIASGSVWYSMAFQITSLGTLNTTGGYFAGLASGTTNFSSTLWSRNDGAGGFNIGLANNTTAANVNWAVGSLSLNTTYYIVANFDVDNDTAAYWLNPSSANFAAGSAPIATASGLTGTVRASLDRFFLRQDSTTATPFVQVDEIRVGTTWADVTPVGVPEPSTYMMLLGGALMMVLVVRRKQATI